VTALKSHPHLDLSEHVGQVWQALEGLMAGHSSSLVSGETGRLAELTARLHDLGKGCAGFQAYIRNPESWNGKPEDKSHTPLSLTLTLLLAKAEEWDPLDALALAACVRGHHGEFPRLPPEKAFEVDTSTATLDDFRSGGKERALKRQMESLDMARLSEACGVALGEWGGGEIRGAHRHLTRAVLKAFHRFVKAEGTDAAVDYRLKVQFLFSLLLEADKAFLAVPDPAAHLDRPRRDWRPEWVSALIGTPAETPVNRLRQQARESVLTAAEKKTDQRMLSLTAPTGIGKTLLAATWALTVRDQLARAGKTVPRIVVVLPFLSIIDQTAAVYRELLQIGGEKPEGSWMLASHSLADRRYDPSMESQQEAFFIDTWRTELVVTTYDQFLMSLADPRARHQMRFHNLCDSLIVLDEVQAVPCQLWQLLAGLFSGLAREGNSRLLLMSATLPPFVSGAGPLLADHAAYFGAFSRYRLHFRLGEPVSLPDFQEEMATRLPEWREDGERVLITMNTRASARAVFDRLRAESGEEAGGTLLFLSADVTPRDRLRKIREIKRGEPCVVVSTQCVEAGVDIDMDRVIRDFGPWDNLVQIAGRCNRSGRRAERGTVEIWDVVNGRGRRFSEMIYDEVALQATRQLIQTSAAENGDAVNEEAVLGLSDVYFRTLDERKDTGRVHLDRFARWREDTPIHQLLRGEQREQHTFVVGNPCLLKAMENAAAVPDRWDRREAWRKLAGKIAAVSVSIYARPRFRAESIAVEHWGRWVLKPPGFYDPERGLTVEAPEENLDEGSLIF
jgi:CRISPR-associated endonuclease/helicase Cas3